MGLHLLHRKADRHAPSLHLLLAMALLGALALQISEAKRPYSSPPSPTPPPSPAPPPPPPSSTLNCTQVPHVTQGPYWIEENTPISNVRLNLSYGVPLNITFKIANASLSELAGTCVPIEGVRVDIWHARWDGVYSDEEKEGTAGETWLRGYQYTNSTGHATFYTIYPGWYRSRTVHIHLRLRLYDDDGNTTLYNDTTQLFFNDTVTDAICADIYPYNDRGSAIRKIFNSNDSLFTATNLISLTGDYMDSDGYSSLVELSLPFLTSVTVLGNGESIRSGNASSEGFASIL